MDGEAISLFEKLDGRAIFWTFLAGVAAGFVAVVVDIYVLNKVESAAGIAVTQY